MAVARSLLVESSGERSLPKMAENGQRIFNEIDLSHKTIVIKEIGMSAISDPLKVR